MATQMLSRLFPKTLTLTTIYSRSLSTTTSDISFLRRLRPLSGAVTTSRRVLLPFHFPVSPSFRSLSTRATTPRQYAPTPNYFALKLRNRCEYSHRLVVMQTPDLDPSRNEPTRDEIVDSYVKTLAEIVGSEDEARMMVYGVSIISHYYVFGTLISEEHSDRIEQLPGVYLVFPDSYPHVNVMNKVCGGEPFTNGQAIPDDPKYHEESVGNARAGIEMV